mmetsp:Transcript_16823/g.34754  ORF Transcript_16823/g.34754 Transcript_16823/m.34754 type:complete len:213 (-) Transcript_16823:1-639(-)
MARCWKDPTTKDAYRLSWASIFITVIAAIAGVTIYASNNSSLALVFGLENCVDFLSSVVVLWRFFAPTKADPSVEEKLQRREKRASIAISIVLIMLGVAILATSFFDFSRGKEDQDENLDQITIISFFSVIAFGTLAAFKFNYANILESASLYKDGLCSLIGTILAGTLFINSLIIEEFTALWVSKSRANELFVFVHGQTSPSLLTLMHDLF